MRYDAVVVAQAVLEQMSSIHVPIARGGPGAGRLRGRGRLPAAGGAGGGVRYDTIRAAARCVRARRRRRPAAARAGAGGSGILAVDHRSAGSAAYLRS
eukprot:COSAG01_NODE_53_length_31352_cov_23.122452_14_plen_98_part_00